MSKKRYSEEFKEQAVLMLINGSKDLEDVSKSLGVSSWSLRQWKKEYLRINNEDLKRKGKITSDEQLRLLKKENADLKVENEILKKFAAILSKEK